MTETKSIEKARHNVFISHASRDKEIARRIATELKKTGVSVWFDEQELLLGDSLANVISEAISSSDYMLVLLSPNSVQSRWVQEELNAAYAHELDRRDITIIPVLIEDCEIPAFLATKQYLDLRQDVETGVSSLVSRLGLAPSIDFERLDYSVFEDMVADLLLALGFHKVRRNVQLEGREIDIVAQYTIADPFGVAKDAVWLVDVKFYRRERIGIRTIQGVTGLLATLPEKYQGLIVTNGQLTSVARQFLEDTERQRVQLRVIDGPELRRLLLSHQELLAKYFVSGKAT